MHTPEPGRSRLLLVEGVPGVGSWELAGSRMTVLVIDAEDPLERSRDRAYRFWLDRP